LGVSGKKKEKELKHLGISGKKKRERVETSWYIWQKKES
jgi:hypothetical protein